MVNLNSRKGSHMFLCGDSADAKGWAYDCGGIVAARAIEPLCMLVMHSRLRMLSK